MVADLYMFKSKMIKIHAIILIVGLLCAGLYFIPNAKAADDSNKRIVKWVDSHGVTHYGDKLPAQEAGRNNTEMNTQGVVVKRNIKADSSATNKEDQEKLDAQRKDNILLSSYTKAEEIDLARDRNLQMDQAALQALTVQKENVMGRSERNQKLAAGFQKRNKPVPQYLTNELKLAKSECEKLDKQIAERKMSMEATRKRFAEEKARFIALKQSSAADSTKISPETLIAENPTAAGDSTVKK